MAEIKTTRKCPECKEDVILESDACVIWSKRYYHKDCFVSKRFGMVNNKLGKDEILKIANDNIESNKEAIQELVDKNHLFTWFMKKYNLITIPSYIYQKISDINSGSWKDMKQGIGCGDLLDMFKRQWSYLEKSYNYRVSSGKFDRDDFSGRLNYDISVIINKAGSYYEWKEKGKQEKKEILENINIEDNIDFNRLSKKQKKQETFIIEEESDLND